jgi:uncharacterized membrane protein (UPF0182 family)
MRKEKTILLSEVRDALLKAETVEEAAIFLNVPIKFLQETIETYPKVIPNVFTIEDDIVDDFTITNDLEDLLEESVESAPKKKKKPTTTATTEEPDTTTEPAVTATATTTVNVQTIAQTVEQELNELFPD